MIAPDPKGNSKLIWTTAFRLVAGILLLGVLVFLPAGTIQYWQGWVYLGFLLLQMLIFALVLYVKDTTLMARRLQLKESQPQQKKAIAGLSIAILAIFVVSGLDRRFGWSAIPPFLVIAADLIILAGYLVYGLTLRVNRFASRTVEVQQGQTVISSGPYSIVRHPMYLAFTLIFGFTPIALGSYWTLLVAVFFPLLLALRIVNEEKVLHESLAGYDEYVHKVRYRLIPFVW
jgi:protein-S-isoprenylcysteine O-methyltransferase Ste14